MKKIFQLLLLLLTASMLFTCRHEPEEPDCKPLLAYDPGPDVHLSWPYNYILDSVRHRDPCFNPTNPDEIAFLIQATGVSGMTLVTYNLKTRVLDTLLNAFFFSEPIWSPNGWIVFQLSDYHFWKIKENGDSLKRFTSISTNMWPVLTNDPNVVLCNNNLADTFSTLVNLDGVILDTLLNTLGYPSQCNAHNKLVGGLHGKFRLYDLNQDTNAVILDTSFPNSHYRGAAWLTDSTVIWSDKEGIYTTNVYTSQKTQLKSLCDSWIYGSPTYAPSIRKVIWTKLIYTQEPDDTHNVYFASRLIMMNPDGTEEEEIDIPR